MEIVSERVGIRELAVRLGGADPACMIAELDRIGAEAGRRATGCSGVR